MHTKFIIVIHKLSTCPILLLVCLSHMFGRHPIISTIPQSQGGYRHLSMISLARSLARSLTHFLACSQRCIMDLSVNMLIFIHHKRLGQTQLSYIPSYYKYHSFGSWFGTLVNRSHIFITNVNVFVPGLLSQLTILIFSIYKSLFWLYILVPRLLILLSQAPPCFLGLDLNKS